jgi:hypothetical protein
MYNEELPVSYSSIEIRMIKSTMADWAIHVARMEVKRSVKYFGCDINKILLGRLKQG